MAEIYYRLEEAKRRYSNLNRVLGILEESIRLKDQYLYLLDSNFSYINPYIGPMKEDCNFVDYQYAQKREYREPENDRVFPLENISINSYRNEHESDLDSATIHTGPYADELARSKNALAITMAFDIFFRNGAYNPASGEGRKILTHELTHVSQYIEGKTYNSEIEELETESVKAEQSEGKNEGEYIPFEYAGQFVLIPRKHLPQIIRKLVHDTIEWIPEQKLLLSEEEYLEFLVRYREWIDMVE